ncbi:MAG: nucleoside kinase [Bacteroidales bacterium]|nr:nucleoside kinase [Candidatus Colimorpha onthohippi]
MSQIEVVLQNTGERIKVPQGTMLADIAPSSQYPFLGALVNNRVERLSYRIYNPKTIFFFDITHRQGWRTYQNTLCFMLYKAVKDVYPQARLRVEYTLLKGFFCSIKFADNDNVEPAETVCQTVKSRMKELVRLDIPFETRTMLRTDAIELLREQDMPETVALLEGLDQLYIDIQYLDGTPHKTGGILAPATGCILGWDLKPFGDGYLLDCYKDTPEPFISRPKLFSIFEEHHKWVDLLHVPTITSLNKIVKDGGSNHLIHVSEALHEKKYASIADAIYQRRNTVKMVLLAGPSSSGKTTSCRRLGVQLSVLGFDVRQISLDDYFVPRSRTPKLPNGEYDFEDVTAIDKPLLNEHLTKLFQGEAVEIPTFDFLTGNPYFSGKKLQLSPNSILIVEGIHALNPILTSQIADELKFKIYVSAITQIAIDDQNVIHSSDNRMIRRIVRDNNFRGWDAYNTLHRWEDVQAGEVKHIYPYQENADVMFNSALLYELGVLRTYAEPQLKRVPENCQEFAEANRLLNFLQLIEPIDAKHIPPTSIMREFLGGSSFDY